MEPLQRRTGYHPVESEDPDMEKGQSAHDRRGSRESRAPGSRSGSKGVSSADGLAPREAVHGGFREKCSSEA